MNAKQTEQITGISRRNLRFYEDQGLIHPERNPDNDYRDYSEEDVEILRKIRTLRMLDVSLEEIASFLKGEKSLEQVMILQENKLRKRQQDLNTAIRFCRELQTEKPDFSEVLKKMDQEETGSSFFTGWVRDYQSVARAEAKKKFQFIPDGEVTTPQQFSDELFAYGRSMDKDIVITHESMEPRFTLSGIEYTAQRVYRPVFFCPVAVIICEAVHPEDFDTEVSKGRSIWMRLFHRWWVLLPLIGLILFAALMLGVTSWLAVVLSALPLVCILVMNGILYQSHTR